MKICKPIIFIFLFAGISLFAFAQEKGYYRYPAIHQEYVIFTAEGDLWKFNQLTGHCSRLTTHHGLESNAAISPDGKQIAFNAEYEGPSEVYIMPFEGGIPQRMTFEGYYRGSGPTVYDWSTDGRLVISTGYLSTLPERQLAIIDEDTFEYQYITLAQADQGTYDEAGNLYFTRLPSQASHTRRYKGGTVQNLWKFDGINEATALTSGYAGTSKNPMYYQGRLYFLTDRDGTMNLWSMLPDGSGLEQHTTSVAWDLKSAKLRDGKVVYQKQADLYVYDLSTKEEKLLNILLVSDFDQKRPYWVKEPEKKIQFVDLSDSGEEIAVTSRGRIFSVPVDGSRWKELTRKSGVRYKAAKFNGKTNEIVYLSDESGEMELWKLATDGFSKPTQLTSGSKLLIMNHLPSPDGKYIAYTEKDYALKVCVGETKATKLLDQENISGFRHLSWSPDSKWIACVDPADNRCAQIKVFNVESGQNMVLTSDRYESYHPVFGPDGNWLYFVSERTFNNSVGSPWGPRQPEPFYNKTCKIYMLALNDTIRSPFLKYDELYRKPGESKKETGKLMQSMDFENAMTRLYEVPVPADNISDLKVTGKYLFWTQTDINEPRNTRLFVMEISNKTVNKPIEVTDNVTGYVLSGNGKKVLVQKADGIYVFDATGAKADLKDAKVSLKNWVFKIDPVEDWKQMAVDAWRLQRDYFYDKNMHGVDWNAVLERHLPLIDRLTDRDELDDVTASMVSELSALHTFVRGGEKRTSPDRIEPASLGARLKPDKSRGGYAITHIFNGDPDLPEERSPLSKPFLKITVGDVIQKIDGVDVFKVDHINQLLNQKTGLEVRLTLEDKSGKKYDQIVVPVSMQEDANLRYSDWEYKKRLEVEKAGDEKIGYFHLRAMGGNNFQEFVKGYYPVFNRQGLIIDVRHNRGGNIDSWILNRLIRKAWFYWQSRAGIPYWNMQYAFRGHVVVLCNEFTASDGEAFAEGVRRLGLGKVIGTRTWGGEIWLTSSNILVDNGIASASEMGVYTGDGEWIIEGHGVDPDIVVDNLPFETFNGKDAQLEAAIEFLKKKIQDEPVLVPEFPPMPDKSFDYNKQN